MKTLFTLIFLLIVTTGVVVLKNQQTSHTSDLNSSDTDNNVSVSEEEEGITPKNDFGSSSGDKVEVYNGIYVPRTTEVLDLSGRNLSGSLKAEIRLLSNLTSLDISNNKFTGLPAEVGQLSKLQILNLSNNQFTGLPQELGNLTNLVLFNVAGNSISPTDFEIITKRLPSSASIITE